MTLTELDRREREWRYERAGRLHAEGQAETASLALGGRRGRRRRGRGVRRHCVSGWRLPAARVRRIMGWYCPGPRGHRCRAERQQFRGPDRSVLHSPAVHSPSRSSKAFRTRDRRPSPSRTFPWCHRMSSTHGRFGPQVRCSTCLSTTPEARKHGRSAVRSMVSHLVRVRRSWWGFPHGCPAPATFRTAALAQACSTCRGGSLPSRSGWHCPLARRC